MLFLPAAFRRRSLPQWTVGVLHAPHGPVDGLSLIHIFKWELQGAWSRRIDSANRLVYMIEDGDLCILSVRDHY